MNDFRAYSPEDIITANLRETEARFDMLCEQEISHLHELASEIAQTEPMSILLASLPDRKPPAFSPSNETLSQSKEALCSLHSAFQTLKSVILCRELKEKLLQKGALTPFHLFSDTENSIGTTLNRIIYQKSSYADSAFLRFSPLITDARAFYTHSFPSACAEVQNGAYEFCILPVENSSEGYLVSFSRLIEQYDLKIVATCDIASNDTDRTTRFALLQRSLTALLDVQESNTFFEMSLPLDGIPELSEVLCAAQLCGLRLYRANSLPQLQSGVRFAAHLSFLTDGSDLLSFLLYLAMEAPHYTPIGLYPHLSQKGK